VAAYETEDGEPRYGKRLSPEELAAYLREQGVEQPGGSGLAAGQVPAASADDAFRRRTGVAPSGRWGGGSGGPTPRRPRRWRTLGVGLVLMLVVPPLLLVAGVMAAVDGSLTRGTPLGEGGAVYLEAGTAAGLYGTSATATTGCAVSDSDGVSVILDTPEAGVPYATFTARQSGAYTVSCPAGTSGLVVGPPMNFDRIPLAAVLILGAGACGVVGLVTTVVGAARARRAD